MAHDRMVGSRVFGRALRDLAPSGACAASLLLAACAAPLRAPPPSAPARTAPAPRPPVPVEAAAPAATVARDPSAALSQAEAVALALERRGELQVADREREVRRLEARQAGRRPNPVVAVEAEDFGGSGGWGGYDEAQTTVWVGQRLELGGKRAARRHEAQLAVELAEADRALVAQEVVGQVRAAFVRALAERGERDLARAAEEATQRFHATVAARVAAGKVSPVEATKAAVALAESRLDLAAAERAEEAARHALARTWGGEVAPAELVGELAPSSAPPPLERLRARLSASPGLQRWDIERERRAALVEGARAATRLDLDVRAGLRRLSGPDETAAVLSVELPVPLFDRRADALSAARARLVQLEDEREAAELELYGRLADAWARLQSAHHEALALEGAVLPDARRVLESMDEGYRQGKFELLDVLDAQRILFQASARRLRALAGYQLALVEIEALLAGPLVSTDLP